MAAVRTAGGAGRCGYPARSALGTVSSGKAPEAWYSRALMSTGREFLEKRRVRATLKRAAARVGMLKPLYRVRMSLISVRAVFSTYTPPDGLPLPPTRFRVLVGGSADRRHFYANGLRAANCIRRLAEETGTNIADVRTVLDFGCGCGRTLRHWRERGVQLYGVDVNSDLVAWCRENLPFSQCSTCKPLPPLDFPAASFDLVYAISVLTHLSIESQQLWLREIARILAPGGIAVISTHGDRVARLALTRTQLNSYRNGEIVVCYADAEGENLCGAYHPASSITALADASGLEHVLYRPEALESHDIHVLRRPVPNESRN